MKIGRVRIHTYRIYLQTNIFKKAGEKLFLFSRDTSRLQADLENTNAEGGRIRQKFGWLNRPNNRRRDMELFWENWSPTYFSVQRYTILFNGHFSLKYLYCYILFFCELCQWHCLELHTPNKVCSPTISKTIHFLKFLAVIFCYHVFYILLTPVFMYAPPRLPVRNRNLYAKLALILYLVIFSLCSLMHLQLSVVFLSLQTNCGLCSRLTLIFDLDLKKTQLMQSNIWP